MRYTAILLLKVLQKCQKSHSKLSKLLDIVAEKLRLRRTSRRYVWNNQQDVDIASVQICYLIKIAVARRESFARYQNVYLRRYRVYIRSTLHVHDITARCSRGAVKPGGRCYFSIVSSRCLARIVFKVDSFTRIHDGVLRTSSRI